MNGEMVLIRVPGDLTEEQREGRACVWCGSEDSPTMVALGMAGGDWLFTVPAADLGVGAEQIAVVDGVRAQRHSHPVHRRCIRRGIARSRVSRGLGIESGSNPILREILESGER